SFEQSIGLGPGIAPGTTYQLLITATYNGRSVSHLYSGIQTASLPPPPPGFWDQKVLGLLPLWLLVVLIIVVVGALIAFLVVSGRLSRGKLVECGECGALIPEADTVCPKCGAEFEVDLVRCSRCGSTIAASSEVCPECAAQLLGTPVPEAKDPERQGYADFVQRFRGEAKKELGDNYGEGAFWDWWKRQPSFVAFNQWKLQQAAGSRAGMAAPVVSAAEATYAETPGADSEEATPAPAPARPPPKGRTPGPAPRSPSGTPPAAAAPSRSAPAAAVRPPEPEPAAGEAAPEPPGLKACTNCGKEIPTDFLVCPFCGSVTR
ncbi:MAG: zinc ribbon domain-containing protein, partial [Thermoplasmata archaeon]